MCASAARRIACLIFLAAALLCLAPAPAPAATKTWIGGTGQWNTAGNWSPSGQPAAGDTVNLTQSDATSRTVTYYNTTNPSAVLKSLKIDATGTGTMTFNMSNNHALNVTTEYVGYDGKGFVTQSAGTDSAATLYLGYNAGGNGRYTITGGTLSSSASLYVGYSGKGTLTVTAGGQVSAATLYASLSDLYGDGTIVVTKGAVLDADLVFDSTHGGGAQTSISFGIGGTLNLTVDPTGTLGAGYKAGATLRINDGVTVTCQYGYLGTESGSEGTGSVTGAGSKWTNSGSLEVGRRGSGSLEVEAGGQVSSTEGYIGRFSGSTGTVTVTGAGSTWTNSGDLYVGKYGSGTLKVEAGGQVSNNMGYLGFNSGSTGAATVTGTGSKWTNSGNLYISNYGGGKLTVADGGLVEVAATFYGSVSDLRGNGTITVAKGALLDGEMFFDAAHGGGPQTIVPFGTGGSLNLTVDPNAQLGAGYGGMGSLQIADGVKVASSVGYLGYRTGATGTATVTGEGSKWSNSGELTVGNNNKSSGTLNVGAGGQVSNTTGYLGHEPGSSGDATVTGTNSKWTNGGSLYVGHFGSGTLNVEAGGQVSSTYGYLGSYFGSTGTAKVTGADSKWTNSGILRVGYYGNGTLKVEAGAEVSSGTGIIGDDSRCSGTVTVTGTGSRWTDSGNLRVGSLGKGTLSITDGGSVSDATAYIGDRSAATGTVLVEGADSVWTTTGSMYVGGNDSAAGGTGTIAVQNGGQLAVGGMLKVWDKGSVAVQSGGGVTTKSVNTSSLVGVKFHVSGNDMLILGDDATAGSIDNSGTVKFYADALLAAGDYKPITEYMDRAIKWSGTGAYKGYGGTWDNTAKVFKVAAATEVKAGWAETLTTGERLLITDDASGRKVGASFGAITGSPTFSAALAGQAEVDALIGTAGFEGQVLAAWDFSTDYGGGDEVMLSLAIGLGWEDVEVWHYSGGVWQEYAPDLLTYDGGGVLSFTVTSFSGWAATGTPEPTTLLLMAVGCAAVAVRHRRR